MTGVSEFRELFRTLHNMDRWSLEEAGVIKPGPQGDGGWTRFNRDLTTFILKLPNDRLISLATLVADKQAKGA